jgi:competence protein ComEA
MRGVIVKPNIRMWVFAWFCVCLLFGTPVVAQQAAPQQPTHSDFPDGPGKATFLKVCSTCHSPTNVLANGQDRAGWESTINKMVGFGAQGTDEEFTEVLDYLTKNFPPSSAPVNVNKATTAQLQSGLGLTATEADAVIKYRGKNGDFKTIDDLKKVPDVDAKKLDAKKDRLAF